MRLIYIKKPTLFELFCLFYSFIRFIEVMIGNQVKVLQTNSILFIFSTAFALFVIGAIKQLFDLFQFCKQKRERDKKKFFSINLEPMVQVVLPKDNTQLKLTTFVIICLAIVFLMANYIEIIIQKGDSDYFKLNLMFQQVFQLILNILFTKLVIKITLYKHHYFSLGLIMIGVIGLHAPFVSFASFINTVPYYLLFSLAWCCFFPYAKIIMERKYLHPLNLAFYWGMGILLLFGILYLIIYLIAIRNVYTQDVLDFPKAFVSLFNSTENTMYSLLYLLIQAIEGCGFLYIIYYKSPITENILIQMVSIYDWIYTSCITEIQPGYFILFLISSFLILVGSFINFELIILNCFDLDKNTTEEIQKRAVIEIGGVIESIEV